MTTNDMSDERDRISGVYIQMGDGKAALEILEKIGEKSCDMYLSK